MFANGFTDESIIASKSGAAWDSRQCETQTRHEATTYGERFFNNLTGWVTSPTGVFITPSGSPDPAIGNTVCFQTGPNLTTPTFIQQKFPLIPANFGLAIFPALVTVGTELADALLLQVQKTENNKNLQMRFTMAGVFLFISGQWAQISTHGNESWCEWWVEVAEANGADVVTIYAGTQRVASITGNLPNGPAGNGGLVYIGQESGADNYRKSQVAYFAIGKSQLFDDLSITTKEYALAVPAKALSGLLVIEDVAESLTLTDLSLEISVNGGAFEPVALVDRGELCKGVIDSAKPIRLFAGTLQKSCAQGAKVTARIKVMNHKFSGIHGFNIVPTSTL